MIATMLSLELEPSCDNRAAWEAMSSRSAGIPDPQAASYLRAHEPDWGVNIANTPVAWTTLIVYGNRKQVVV